MSDSRSKPEGRRPVGAPSQSDESAGRQASPPQPLDIMTKPLERVELKPCPFCGGDAHLGTIKYSQPPYENEELKNQLLYYSVNCAKCLATLHGMSGYPEKAQAIEAWNTRAAIAALESQPTEGPSEREQAVAVPEKYTALWYAAISINHGLHLGTSPIKLPTEMVREALVKVAPLFPITINETADYAELTFGEHQTQAMTMAPAEWLALQELYTALASLDGKVR